MLGDKIILGSHRHEGSENKAKDASETLRYSTIERHLAEFDMIASHLHSQHDHKYSVPSTTLDCIKVELGELTLVSPICTELVLSLSVYEQSNAMVLTYHLPISGVPVQYSRSSSLPRRADGLEWLRDASATNERTGWKHELQSTMPFSAILRRVGGPTALRVCATKCGVLGLGLHCSLL